MEFGTTGQNRIPFKPMEFGEILDYSFRLYRQTWKSLIPIGLVSALPYILSQGFMQVSYKDPGSSTIFRMMAGAEYGDFSGLALLGGIYLAVFLITILTYPLINGAIVATISRTYLGEETTFGQAFRVAGSRYWALLGTGLLFGLMLIVALPVFVIAGLIILFFITVPAGYAVLMTYFVFTTHAIVVEGTPGGIPAFSRSARLVSGRFWPLLGLGLVFGLLAGILSSVLSLVTTLPLTLVQMFVSPNPVWGWLSAILGGIGMAVMTPFTMIGMTLAYYDTRMRKEGFDLEMLANTGVNSNPS